MGTEGKAVSLRVYVARHCSTCAEAFRLVAEARAMFTGINIEVIDLELGGRQDLENIFSVPTYVLDGRTIFLGNPSLNELFSHIAEALS